MQSGGAPKRDVGHVWNTDERNVGHFMVDLLLAQNKLSVQVYFKTFEKTSCFSTRNHPDNWLPWINPTRTTDRAGWQKPSSKRRSSIFEEYYLNDVEK